MIGQKEIITINPGVEYLSEVYNQSGESLINWLLMQGRVLLNKSITGCGFTSGCLENGDNIILAAPRILVLLNKLEQYNMASERNPNAEELLFYFDREKDLETLKLKLWGYLQDSDMASRPYKLLVTYDSFIPLLEILESEFGFCINECFRIVIDESHCIIKDIKLKQYRNKATMSRFLSRAFQYNSVLFVSATPIENYLQRLPQFKQNDVAYVELNWLGRKEVVPKTYKCSNPSDAFNQIYKDYEKQVDQWGNHYFDVIYNDDGTCSFSYEAVIFLNSVADIMKVLKTYFKKPDSLIGIGNVSVICADTNENRAELKKTGSSIKITKSVPKPGNPHPTWTFCTRTCFIGVDFYSPSASTFVIVNYKIESLSLDIACDIPQIIGRQRLKVNPFRERIHIYYTNNLRVIDDQDFATFQNEKMVKSLTQISKWKNLPEVDENGLRLKDSELEALEETIQEHPERFYITTQNGYPEIDDFLMTDEEYNRDIAKNQIKWFVLSGQGNTQGGYSLPVQTLKDELLQIPDAEGKLRRTYDCAKNYPMVRDELNLMLWTEGYDRVAYYINNLSLDRLYACGFNTTKLDHEIKVLQQGPHIEPIIYSRFQVDQIYTREKIKKDLGEIYTAAGLKKTPKATDLEDYFKCIDCKKGGQRAYLLKAK